MRFFTKRLGIIATTFFLLFTGFAVLPAEAQKRGDKADHRPIVRYVFVRDPFWYNYGWYDPFWRDRYYYDPYVRYQRERYRREEAVRDAIEELEEEQDKAWEDGVVTTKERKDIAEQEQDLVEARTKLNRFYRDHG